MFSESQSISVCSDLWRLYSFLLFWQQLSSKLIQIIVSQIFNFKYLPNFFIGQDLFFIITLLTVVLVNGNSKSSNKKFKTHFKFPVFGSFLTAGLYGIACRFSSRYISAVVSGQALGGMFPALVYIISLAIGVSSTHCALLYFNIANITIVICLVSYFAVYRSVSFFKLNQSISKSSSSYFISIISYSEHQLIL